jgi:MATE family multidrug resistance protein
MSAPPTLPAARVAADGRLRIDWSALLRIAAPLMVTNAIQSILSLTDTWYIGRLSTEAVAAIGAIYWLITCVVLILGGVGLAVQTFASQAEGGGRRRRASQSAWNGLWSSLFALPLFALAAALGAPLISAFALSPGIETLALEYWEPRVGGAFLGAMTWAAMSFFNAIGATRITLVVALVTTLANVPANEFFMFHLGWGMSGAAWGTNVAQLVGLMVGMALLWWGPIARRYSTRLTWRPRLSMIRRQLAVGLPIGVMYGADVLGVALMQLMVTRVDTAGAAATQIVMMLTSLAYLPAIGLATAGTSVVGQAIGAGDRDWARHLGTSIILCCAGFMTSVAVLLLLFGPWVLPWFLSSAEAAVQLALLLLWPATAYQLFDGLNFGSSFCLRAAGDTRVPAITALLLSWLLFIPLAHMLVFNDEQAWIAGLPQWGLGALGGWLALMSYVVVLGTLMFARWRSNRWQRIDLWGGRASTSG